LRRAEGIRKCVGQNSGGAKTGQEECPGFFAGVEFAVACVRGSEQTKTRNLPTGKKRVKLLYTTTSRFLARR